MQERKEKWMTKPLHGQLLRQTQQIADAKSVPEVASCHFVKFCNG